MNNCSYKKNKTDKYHIVILGLLRSYFLPIVFSCVAMLIIGFNPSYGFISNELSKTMLGGADETKLYAQDTFRPVGIANDSSGNIWVFELSNKRITEFTPSNQVSNGTASVALGEPSLTAIGGGVSSRLVGSLGGFLAFDSSGNLWATDTGNNRVLKFPKANLVTGGSATVVLGQTSFTSSSSGTSSYQLNTPRGIAFDSSGNLWVVDSANNRVLKFPPANQVTNGTATVVLGQGSFTTNTGIANSTGLHNPYGITFDSSGNLWVADSSNSRVLKFPKANLITHGTATVVLGQASFTTSTPTTTSFGFNGVISPAFDSSGNLWVSDSLNHRVLEFPPANQVTNGTATVVLGHTSFTDGSTPSGASATDMNQPQQIFFDSSGNLWVADEVHSRVLGFTPANQVTGGSATKVLGQTEFTHNGTLIINSIIFVNPDGLAFDSSGNMWVADSSYNRVLKFPKANLITGGSATVVLGQASFTSGSSGLASYKLSTPRSIVFDSSGNLWVVDSANNRVLKFPPANQVTNGSATVVLGQASFTSGGVGCSSYGMTTPYGITFDSSGNLWVAEKTGARVLKFPPANQVTNGTATVVLSQSSFTNCSVGTSLQMKSPEFVVFDSSGNLWVSDSLNHRVLMVPPANQVTGGIGTAVLGQTSLSGNSLGTTSSKFNTPVGLAFDSSGNLFVADSVNNRILEFPPANQVTGGSATVVLGQSTFTSSTSFIPPSAVSISSVQGLVFDSSGNLWAGDDTTHRVISFPNASSSDLSSSTSLVSGSNVITLGNMQVTVNANDTFTNGVLNIESSTNNPENVTIPNTGVGSYYRLDTNIPDVLYSRNLQITYSSSDVSGLNETALKIERFSSNVWNELSSTVHVGTKTVLASTSGFSTFGLSTVACSTCNSDSGSGGGGGGGGGTVPSSDSLFNNNNGLDFSKFSFIADSKSYQLQVGSNLTDEMNVRWTGGQDISITSMSFSSDPIVLQFPVIPFKLKGSGHVVSDGIIPFNLKLPNRLCDVEKGITMSCIYEKTYSIPVKIIAQLDNGTSTTQSTEIKIFINPNIQVTYLVIFGFAGVGILGLIHFIRVSNKSNRKKNKNTGSITSSIKKELRSGKKNEKGDISKFFR